MGVIGIDAYAYPSKIVGAHEGGWLIAFRDFPEGHSQAEEDGDVVEAAEGLLQACIEARLLDGQEVPEPSDVRAGELLIGVPIETATKAALFKAIAGSGTSRLAIAKVLGMDEKEVRRMLDPRHASKLPRVARVLKALGKELRLSVVDRSTGPRQPKAGEARAGYRVKWSSSKRRKASARG